MKQDYIACPLCNIEYHKMGIQTHFKFKHNKSWSQYNLELLNRKCPVCGESIKNKDRVYCSQKCMSIYGASQIRHHRNKYSEGSATKEFKRLSKDLKKTITDDYLNNEIMSIKDLVRKYELKRETLAMIFKENNVKIKDVSNLVIRERNIKEFHEFASSNIAKQIVKDYKENEFVSIRSLYEKYKVFHINKHDIKEILKFYKIEFKDGNEVRKKIWEKKFEEGIRHPNYGKHVGKGGNANWYYYKDHYFQGSFEFKFALWLETNNIVYLHHKSIKSFEYINHLNRSSCYHPDFFLPETNEYIEIKGYFSEEAKKKMNTIINQYKDFKFIIYDTKKLQDIDVLEIDKKLGININQYRYQKNISREAISL